MSATVDERIVEMQFNNEQFEKNVHQSINTLDELKQSLELGKTAKGLNQFQNGINKLNLDGLAGGFSTAFNKISVGTMALYSTIDYFMKRAIASVERFVKSFSIDEINAGWNRFGEMTSAVQIIMSATRKEVGLLYDNEKDQMAAVSDMMSQLNRFSDETSYSFTEMANSVGKFTSVGVDLKDAQIAIQGVATWAASAGRTTTEASRAMYQLSQAMGSGAMKLMDWRSIENLTMGTVEFKQAAMDAAVAAGTLTTKIKNGEQEYYTKTGRMLVTTNNFRETLQKGWFTSDVLTDVLKQYGSFSDQLMKYLTADDAMFDSATQVKKYLKAWEDGEKDLETIANDLKQPVEDVEEAFYRLTSFSGSDNSEQVMTKYAERYKMKVEDLSEWTNKYLQDPNSFGKEDWAKLSEITGQSTKQLQKDFKAMKKSIKTTTMDTYAKKFGMSVTELGKAYKEYKKETLDFEALSKQTGIAVKDLQKDFAEMAKTDMELSRAAFEKAQEAKTLKEAIDATHDAVQTGWANIFKAIFGEYLDAKELWTGISEALWTAFAGQFTDVEARLKGIFEPFREAGGVENFTEALGNLAEVINHVNGIFINTLLDAILPESGEKLADLAEKFKTSTENFKESVKNSEFLQTFGSALRVIFAVIGKAGSLVAKVLGSIGKAIGSLFKSKDTKNGMKLADTLDNIANAIKNFEIPENVKEGFNKFLSMAAGLAGILAKALGAVWNVIKGVGGAIASILGPVIKNFGSVLSNAFKSVSDFFGADDFSFKKLFLSMFKSDDAKAKAEKFFEDVKTAISTGIDEISKWISEKSEKVKNALLGLFGGGENGEGGNSSATTAEKTVKKIGFIQQIMDAIRNLFSSTSQDSDTGNLDKAASNVEKQVSIATRIHDAVVKFLSTISLGLIDEAVVDKVVEVCNKGILAVLDVLGTLFDSIGGISVGSISVKNIDDLAYLRAYIMEIVKTILLIRAASAAINVAKSMTRMMDSFSGIMKSIKDIPNRLEKLGKKMINAWRTVQIVQTIPDILKQLAILLGLVVAAVMLFGYLDQDKIHQGMINLGLVAAGLLAFMTIVVLLVKWLTKGENGNAAKEIVTSYAQIGMLTGALIGLSILLVGLAGAISKIGKLNPDQFWRGTIVVGAFTLIFGALFALLYVLSAKGKNQHLENAATTLNSIGKAMRKIGASLLLIALSMAVLGAIPILFLAKAVAVLVILGTVFTVMTAVNNLTSKKGATNQNASNTFVGMAKAMLAAAASIILLAAFGPNDIKEAAKVIGELLLVMVVMTGLIRIIASTESSLSSDQINGLNKTLGSMSVMLLAVAATLVLLNKFGPSFGKGLGQVGLLVLLLAAMTAATIFLVKFGQKAKPKALESAGKAMVMMSACLLITSGAIAILAKIPWDEAGNMTDRLTWIIGFFAVMGLLLVVMSSFSKMKAKDISAIGTSMLMMSGTLAVIAIVMNMLGKIPATEALTSNVEKLAGLFLELSLAIGIMAALKDANAKKFSAIGKSMLMVSGVFVILAIVMNTLWKIPMDKKMNIKLAWLVGMFGLLAATMIVLAKMKEATGKKLEGIATNMIYMSLVFYTLAGAIAAVNLITIDNTFKTKMIALIGAFVAMSLAMIALAALAKNSKGLTQAVIAMLTVSASLLIVVASMKILETVPWQVIAGVAGVILAMAIAIGVLGAIATSPVGVGMLIVAAAMLALSTSVLMLSLAAIGFGAAVLIFVSAINLLGEAWSKNGDAIKNAIESLILALPKLGTAFGLFIANMLKTLAQGLVDMLNVFNDNREAIASGLYTLASIGITSFARALVDASGTVANAIVQIILTICNTIVNYTDTIVIMFQAAIIKVVNGIIDLSYLYTQAGIGLAMGLVGGFMKAVGEKLSGTGIGELFGIGSDWVKKGQEIIDKAKIELPDGFEEAYNQAKSMAEGFKAGEDEVTTAAEGIMSSVKQVFSGGSDTGSSSGSILSNMFGDMGDLTGIAEKFKGMLSPESLGIDTSQFDISKWFNFEGLSSKLSGGDILGGLTSSLTSGMTSAGDAAGAAGGDALLSSISTTLSSKGSSVLGGALNGAFDSRAFNGDGQEIGSNIVDSIAGGIKSSSGKLTNAATDASNGVKSGFEAGKDGAKTAGANVMLGFADGIRANQSTAINAANAVANKVIKTLRRAMQIKSPSRLTREMGEYLDEGLALGIKDGTDGVVNQSTRMTDRIRESFSAAVGSAYDMLNSDINLDPTIRPVVDLSDVKSKTKSLNSIFDKSVATSVNLANSVGPRAAASIANRQAASTSQTNSNNVTLYVDGIKYNSDDYIDSSISGFMESMIRRGKMYGRA